MRKDTRFRKQVTRGFRNLPEAVGTRVYQKRNSALVTFRPNYLILCIETTNVLDFSRWSK